jgi:kynurenine formamidase
MNRVLDLSFKPYPAHVGDSNGNIRPVFGFQPGAPIVIEPIGEQRTLTDVLSYYRLSTSMSGVQPGELFHKGLLTTKPYTTYATYYNPDEVDPWAGQYLADLPATELAGEVTIVDLEHVEPKDVIERRALADAIGDAPTRIVFLRTGYSKRRPKAPDIRYQSDSPVLSLDAARWLGESGVRVLGGDVRTFDPRYAGRGTDDVYGTLNRAGIIVVEDLANLDHVQARHGFVFVGVPLALRFARGGPARVFAVDLDDPSDFVDCTHPLDFYPKPNDDELPFIPPSSTIPLDDIGDYPNPWPGRIEPRDDQQKTQRTARLIPFRLRGPGTSVIGDEMYIEYGHSVSTHIEGAFFDPWGRHGVPEEILRRYVRMPADRLIGEGCILDLSELVGGNQQIDYTHLKRADPGLKEGDICVLRADMTEWEFYGPVSKTPGLSPDAAKWLVEKKIRALVLDFVVEKSDPVSTNPAVKYTPNKIHYFLHKNDIPVVEWAANLKTIRKDRFVIAMCALQASHHGGFPVHIFAVERW